MQDTDEGMTAAEQQEAVMMEQQQQLAAVSEQQALPQVQQVPQVPEVQQVPQVPATQEKPIEVSEEDMTTAFAELAPNYESIEDGSEFLVPVMDENDQGLYSNYEEKPALAQNFLQSQYSVGINTGQDSRNYIQDIRGYPQNVVSLEVISPFNNPTITPDTQRRSIADVS